MVNCCNVFFFAVVCLMQEMGLDNEVATLEKQKKLLEKIPGMELNEETKKLRQACFKSNYKKRRLITFHH